MQKVFHILIALGLAIFGVGSVIFVLGQAVCLIAGMPEMVTTIETSVDAVIFPAIALIIECLCSCLTGSDNGQTMGSFYDMGRVQNTGFCLAAIDLSKVIAPQVWNDRMAELLASIRACPRQPGVDEIKIPGQPEHETCERRLAEGLELPEAVEQELRQLAAHYQVEYMTESPAGGGPQSGASHRTCRA